jgi:hypothetical protein
MAEEVKSGWWLLPAIIAIPLMAIGPCLPAFGLVILPAYIIGFADLSFQYKATVLSLFFLVGLLSNLLLVGRKKRTVLYQLAWTLYVAAYMGLILLVRAWSDHVSLQRLGFLASFYGSYLLLFFLVIRIFHIKFRYFSKDSKLHRLEISKEQKAAQLWKLLTLALVLFFGWLFLGKWNISAAGFRSLRYFLPSDAFVVIFPDNNRSSLIWPGFYAMGGFIAFLPILMLCSNFAEWAIRWVLVELRGGDASALEHEVHVANHELLGGVKWMTLPLLPFVIFGLTHFYYLDPQGIHHVRWPQATENHGWNEVGTLQMSAWGDGESSYVYHMRYSIKEPYDNPLNVSWNFLQGISDHDTAASYLGVSRALKNNRNLKLEIEVSPKGKEFLKIELGEAAKDLLVEPRRPI